MSMLVTHNVTIQDRRTSIRLEPELWNCLVDIANTQSLTIQELCTGIYLGHGSSSYTAAVRVFILLYYWQQASERRVHSIIGPLPSDEAVHRDPRYRSSYTRDKEDFDRRTIWNRDRLDLTPQSGMFLAYWQWVMRRRALGRLPRYDELLTGPFADELARGTVNIIDTTPDTPEGFLLSHLSSTSMQFKAFAGQKAIGDLSFKLHAQSLAQETQEVKQSAEPHVASISQRHAGVNRAYVRLALPLGDQTGRVVRIATIVRGLRTTPSIFNDKLLGLQIPVETRGQAARSAPPAPIPISSPTSARITDSRSPRSA
ncbi:putative DNA-binding ribbon-helix-helix protein [Constrictibacter sp. MBR-5]